MASPRVSATFVTKMFTDSDLHKDCMFMGMEEHTLNKKSVIANMEVSYEKDELAS